MRRHVTIALALGLAGLAPTGCRTSARQPSRPSAVTGRPTAATVALRRGDLPPGLYKCPYSGSIDAYLAHIRERNPELHQSVAKSWEQFKAHGATDGYAAFYGNNRRACDAMVSPEQPPPPRNEVEHAKNHPKSASSFVVAFPDVATAEATYVADLFQQSALGQQTAMDVVRGDPRLGPNSIAAASKGSPIPTRQAVWQSGAFNILFSSTAIERAQSEFATSAMTRRTR